MTFQRTFLGKVNKALFVAQPVIYVEGVDDLAFFAPLQRRIGIRIEVANGKPEANKLANRLVASGGSYCVLLDGDFDALLGMMVAHPQVLYLDVYSIENLLADDRLLVSVVADHCACQDAQVPATAKVVDFLQENIEPFKRVVRVDLASRLVEPPVEALPARIEKWVAGPPPQLKPEMQVDLQEAEARVAPAAIERAEGLLNGMQDAVVCIRYLRGHLVFGLIRLCVFAASKSKGKKMQVDDRSLLRLLSERFWAGDTERSGELLGKIGAMVASATQPVARMSESQTN